MATEELALIRLLLAVAASAALAACSLPGPYRPEAPAQRVADAPPPVEATPEPAPVVAPPPPSAPLAELPPAQPAKEFHLGPAAQSLVNQAHAQASRGELPAASTTLDRAIRIEPQNPLVWLEVARLRLSESDPRQAESCARKALTLGSASPSARIAAGHVLADALRAQHRDAEARDLEAQPWMAN
jgi:cytochrome c-type biogenesis protein CcmH/NrfG